MDNLAEENISISSKGIRKKVKNSESIAFKRYKIDNYILLDLDNLLNDVYCSFRPTPAHYHTRKELVKNLNVMATDIYGNSNDSIPVLEAYGSFVMDMFSPQSDLDVSINFANETTQLPRDMKIQILTRFAEKLLSLQGHGYVRNVESIFSARVPIVKFIDQGTDIECDLSVENKDGILNSQIIHIISQIDDRFQKLCMLIKHWAKAHEVNSALHRTLNSVSITLLVAHHLQTQNPPILPPFSVLFKDGIDPSNVVKRTQKFLNWGQRNKESLGRLFVTFFVKLQSVEFLWRQGLCVSLLSGLWISKKWKKNGPKSISVEDFIDVRQNVARRVSGEGAKKIYGCINKTIEDVFEFLNGKVDGTHVRNRLFGQQAVVGPPPMPPFSVYRNEEEYRSKRVCLENGYRVVQGTCQGKEERYENLRGKRNRYTGNCNGFQEFNETPRYGIHNNSLYDLVSLNSHSFHHRQDGRFSGEELMPVGPRQDYSRRIDQLPYGRVSYENPGPQNFPQPYFGRPF